MPSTRPTVDPVLDILEELGYDFDELDGDGYKRSIREAIFRTHPDTGGKTADPEKFQILNEEFKKIRRGGPKPSEVEAKEKKSTIKGAKLLPGRGNFSADDIKPVDVEKKEGDAPALMPDRLDNIANTVDSIALLLRRQFKLETKQQRDAKIKQDKDAKDSREDDLEKKPKDKKTGLIPNAIKKPALSFFEKLKRFFLNIVIGAGAIKLMEWLKDPANAEKITKFKDFLINNAGWILGGLAAIALLPIALSLVSVVQGVLAGLSLLGPLLPALPWILGGLLVGAVAWWIGKKISRAITGGQVIGKERKENVKRLRAAGIQDATKNSLTLINEKGTGRMKVNMYGENSITGREAIPGKENKNARVNLDLMVPEHADWYVKNYGQAALDEKLAAHKSFRDTKAALIETKKDMQAEIKEMWGDKKREHFKLAREEQETLKKSGASTKEINAAWTKQNEDWNVKRDKLREQEKKIRKKHGDEAIKIGDKAESSTIDKNMSSDEKTSATIDKNMSSDEKTSATIDKNISSDEKISATVDKNLKKETNISPPNTKGNGGNTSILNGGGGGQQQSVGGGSGTGGSSTNTKFGSQDPNNYGSVSTKATYNLVGV